MLFKCYIYYAVESNVARLRGAMRCERAEQAVEGYWHSTCSSGRSNTLSVNPLTSPHLTSTLYMSYYTNIVISSDHYTGYEADEDKNNPVKRANYDDTSMNSRKKSDISFNNFFEKIQILFSHIFQKCVGKLEILFARFPKVF